MNALNTKLPRICPTIWGGDRGGTLLQAVDGFVIRCPPSEGTGEKFLVLRSMMPLA